MTDEHRTVGSVMSRPVVSGHPSDTIAFAASTMRDHGVGSVVIVDGERPIGILTERDLVRFAAAGADAAGTKVSEWMTEQPDTVTPATDAAEAFHALAAHGYRHIPVVEAGALKGIVSMRDLMAIAQIGPVDAPRGLQGVVVAETAVGDVRGEEGFFHYRQYSGSDLARTRSFEDAWHLLFTGRLPTPTEAADFTASVAGLRGLPDEVRDQLPAISRAGSGDLLAPVRTALSLTADVLGLRPTHDIAAAELEANARQLCAIMPTLVMAIDRLRRGEEAIPPRPDLNYAANYLWMLDGNEPSPKLARALEQYLILTIDHGFNASTFTARVITSTGADLGAALVGAIGALSGPLHGGAPSRALDMLDAIGDPSRAESWIRDAVTHGDRIMGFGHRVYKTDDPRSTLLREVAADLGGPLADLAAEIEGTVVRVLDELKPGRRLYANVEFYAGVVMASCGLPRHLFTPTFTCSRTVGWCAHVLEQAANNRLIRPSARYVGPPPPAPVPAR